MRILLPALALTLASAAGAATPVPTPAASAPVPAPVTRATFLANVDTNFQRNDTNHDGYLSKAEIAVVELRAQQQIEAQLTVRRKQAFDKVDTNHDGTISFAEFAAAVPGPKADDGSKAIAALDSDKDGKVSPAEFRAPATKRFEMVDKNRDGVASVDELRGTNK